MNTYFYLIATFPDYYLIITRYIEKNAETCVAESAVCADRSAFIDCQFQ